MDCDIFIPAALELEVGPEEAKLLKCKLIVEGANGPTDPGAEEVLAERGIAVIPDILANSGGVIVSYYEWLQNKRSERWDVEDVEARLERRMVRTFTQAHTYAQERNIDLRMACYGIGLDRIQKVYRERGIFP
jgi:glutamate dehydrogenase (NAD(P)+)